MAESKRPRNVRSESLSEKNTHEDRDETKEQLKLWRDAEKKKKWYDAPAKVKVGKDRGIYLMEMEVTLGVPPQTAYDILSNNPANQLDFRNIKGRGLLENISRKYVTDDDTGPIIEVEKIVTWKFLWWSRATPISVHFAEKPKDLAGVYDKKKMMFMNFFSGNWRVKPIYVDSERLCKHMMPKSQEEYTRCSGGQGKIGSKVIINQAFQPSFPYDQPPLSWYVRWITVKTTKTLLQDLQNLAAAIRGV